MIETAAKQNNIKYLATLLLLISAALFLVSKLYENTHPIFPWLRAFSEAAMVGALADWFAVTALFRRPLGLPIPHTGIIPRNQARIANTLGRFIYENFLTPATLAPKLREAKLAEKFSTWLSVPASAKLVAVQMKDFAITALKTMKQGEVSGFLKVFIPSAAAKLHLGPLLSEIISAVRVSDKEGKLFDEILTKLEKGMGEHQAFIQELVSKDLPWYIPTFVKNHLYNQVAESIKKTVAAVRADKEHLLRKQLGHLADKGLLRLKEDPMWEQRLQQGVAALCEQSTLLEYLQRMSVTLIDILQSDEKHLFQEAIETVLLHSARSAKENEVFAAQANEFAAAFVLRMVQDYGENVGHFVETTMGGWDAGQLVAKIESEVGRDLQFIRINGTLVGGLVGLVLYALDLWINQLH